MGFNRRQFLFLCGVGEYSPFHSDLQKKLLHLLERRKRWLILYDRLWLEAG